MTEKELLGLAKYGIEEKIGRNCYDVVNTWVSPNNIAALKKLIAQYDEIVQEYDAARNEEDTNAERSGS